MAKAKKVSSENGSDTKLSDSPVQSGAVYETAGDTSSSGDSGFSGSAPDVKAKLAIPMRSDGSIDLDSMRASTRAKLESAIKSTPSLTAPAGSPLSEKDCEYLLSVVSGIRVFAAIKGLGIPKEIAENVIPYTPEQVKDLSDPLKETAASLGVGLMPPWARLLMVAGAIDMGNMMEIKIQVARMKARAAMASSISETRAQ